MDSGWGAVIGVGIGSVLTGLWQWIDSRRRRRDAADARAAAFARELRAERRVIYARLLSDLRSFKYHPADSSTIMEFPQHLLSRSIVLTSALDDLYLVAGQEVLDAAERVRVSISARAEATARYYREPRGERFRPEMVASAKANVERVDELAAAMRAEVTTDIDPSTQPR
ncbi:hypothetical protein [Pseudactinotalea terrae]|uniref:hypothetical protein n=1 Tax=Pseudactinotalea terrae TaxID=1743262 RepID=UPI0012E19BE5|nr:hypothetical protein [Pseudactinotalea terrae]